MNVGKLFSKYRTHVLLGLGGVAAFFAYQSRTQQAVAAREAIAAAAPAGDAGTFWQGIQAGSQITAAGVAQGMAPTEASLGLAGHSVAASAGVAQGAQALASAISGDFAGLGGLLGNALAGIVQAVAPQQLQQPPPAAAPPVIAPPPTTQQPAAAAPAAEQLIGYRVAGQSGPSGNNIRAFIVNPTTGAMSERNISLGDGDAYPAQRMVSAGRLHWRMTSGKWSGISIVPGVSTPISAWYIQRVVRRADGSTYATGISDFGS